VPKAFIEKGFKQLRIGGKIIMVVKRLDWYRNKLATVFGGARVVEDDGYYILTAEKKGKITSKQKEKKTTKKHEKLQSFKSKKR
jgi:16S rRNA (guanine1207-N2)-methyltransferase